MKKVEKSDWCVAVKWLPSPEASNDYLRDIERDIEVVESSYTANQALRMVLQELNIEDSIITYIHVHRMSVRNSHANNP